jgi:predicted CopG family antitoxin
MSNKSISPSEEVYARLEAKRGEGESIGDVITRLNESKSLMNLVGFLKEAEAEEVEKVISDMRGKSKSRTASIIERMKQ